MPTLMHAMRAMATTRGNAFIREGGLAGTAADVSFVSRIGASVGGPGITGCPAPEAPGVVASAVGIRVAVFAPWSSSRHSVMAGCRSLALRGGLDRCPSYSRVTDANPQGVASALGACHVRVDIRL